MTKLPIPLYQPYGRFSDGEWAAPGDVRTSLEAAMTDCIDAMEKRYITEFRVYRIDHNPDTGLPERVEDVSEEGCVSARKWFAENSFNVPYWLEAAR